MKYSVIYADPPWFYNDRRKMRLDGKTPRFGIGAQNHYQLMKDQDILNLPVQNICNDDAVLFLWVTCPRLDLGIKVLEHWGFKYVTAAFTWVKTNKVNGELFFGIGYYTKSNAELCLLGKRGRTLVPACNTVSQIVMAPRMAHSAKPLEVIYKIDRMYPGKSAVELFARSTAPGWDAIGNEIDGRDIREVIT